MNSTRPELLPNGNTFSFLHEGVDIFYPAASVCGRFPVSPAEYGFQVVDTGGGCTAWRREFMLEGEPVHMLITAGADGCNHELTPYGTLTLGVYADSGAWWVTWDQDFGSPDTHLPYNIMAEGI